jgi:hypothetical protein
VAAVKSFVAEDDVEALFRDKLESSGIAEDEARALGMTTMTATESEHAGLWELPALKIPYFDPMTGNPMTSLPGRPQFYRARALRMPLHPPKGFSKYLQPPGAGVCAYFPKAGLVDWPAVLQETQRDIYITEGELKAAKGALCGYNVIGLGGVDSFRSAAPMLPMLPELEAIKWLNREVYLVFDSDLIHNAGVRRAAIRLSKLLMDRGANPRLVYLPEVPGIQKTGLDDCLKYGGTAMLDAARDRAMPMTAAKQLLEFNNKYAVLVEGNKEVINLETGGIEKADNLVHHTPDQIEDPKPRADGKPNREQVNLAEVWLKWPLRNIVRRPVYDPAEPPLSIFQSSDGGYDFNKWKGWAVTPVEGDITPFLTLIDHLFTGAEPHIKKWFLDWLAYPVKFPGTKLFTAAMLHGRVQGTGKSLVGETMSAIYGKAATTIMQAQLTGDFSEWAPLRSFVMCDDITIIDRRETHDKLKMLITQKKMWVNEKYKTSFEIDDHINWYFTSNRFDALALDRGERRFFVWEVLEESGMLSHAEFYKPYGDWLGDEKNIGPGPAALLHWFQARDLSGFSPSAPAPPTQAKEDMRRGASTSLALWVEDLRESPDTVLVCGGVPITHDLVTLKQLKTCFVQYDDSRLEDDKLSTRLSRTLRDVGVEQFFKHDRDASKFRIPGAEPDRYYIVRNHAKWSRKGVTIEEAREHLSRETQKPKKTQKY